jgi:hypothetical protein
MRVVSENSDDDLKRRRVDEELGYAIRALTANLPEWCGRVTAVDAFDAAAILEYGGDRTLAMRQMAERFGLTKAAEKKALAKTLFQMIRRQAAQQEIEATAYDEGAKLGLSRDEVCRVALWVADKLTFHREAA